MALTYDYPEPTSNELASGWFPPDEYVPSEPDYEEMAEAQLESAVASANISLQRRLRDQLDRAIAEYERAPEPVVGDRPF